MAESPKIAAAPDETLDDCLPARFVTLDGGLVVPAKALQLALDLEARGLPLATDADHQFVVPDDPRLTEVDQAAISRWRQHLSAIVEYQAPAVPLVAESSEHDLIQPTPAARYRAQVARRWGGQLPKPGDPPDGISAAAWTRHRQGSLPELPGPGP